MKKASVWGLAACVFLCLAVSCGLVGPCYIGAPEKKTGVQTARLHLFFDKTGSIQGFTIKGDDSQYVQTLPLLWQVGNTAFAASAARFFDYGTEYTNEFRSAEAVNYVKRDVLRRGFYESNLTGGYRTYVHRNGGQPFSGVAEYIKTLNEPGSAYIVITDLYEQNRENPFFLFFRDAFSRGLSGALFAVESTFSGDIYSFSYVRNEEDSIKVRDGIATFFICIIGDSDIVYAYSAELAKELNAKSINFHNAVFMVKAPQETGIYHGDPVMAGDARRYGKEENALKSVNLRRQDIEIINQNTSPYRAPESYQILTKIGSRWTAGLALKNINRESFKYTAEFSLFYFDGKRVKTGSDGPAQSPFIGKANSTVISAKVIHVSDIDSNLIPENTDDYPVYLVVETNNRVMDKGWYKINCVIIPEAIPKPDWVTGLNAESIPALRQSANTAGGHVKVLELANVYEKIADAYNKALPKTVYSDELYLLKR
jgi:hypothetical protein